MIQEPSTKVSSTVGTPYTLEVQFNESASVTSLNFGFVIKGPDNFFKYFYGDREAEARNELNLLNASFAAAQHSLLVEKMDKILSLLEDKFSIIN